jgi:hypothetical protein
MSASKLLALLPTEPDMESHATTLTDLLRQGASALVRDSSGHIRLEALSEDVEYFSQVMRTGCFRRGSAIIDPTTRQVMGYEMEMIAAEA